jgi:hypothetical protein
MRCGSGGSTRLVGPQRPSELASRTTPPTLERTVIERVISGGQTGADQAGWKAAKEAGIPTGGWMPKGRLTEDGPLDLSLAMFYGAIEHPSPLYPPRTECNVRDSDVTIWFGNGDSAGYWCTKRSANRLLKPFWTISSRDELPPLQCARQIAILGYKVINIAGNRGSKTVDGGAWVERYLAEVFVFMEEQP